MFSSINDNLAIQNFSKINDDEKTLELFHWSAVKQTFHKNECYCEGIRLFETILLNSQNCKRHLLNPITYWILNLELVTYVNRVQTEKPSSFNHLNTFCE